jgi:endogenous inhibitor of DNA gyrase (YacG/DUF329 family)
MSDPAAVPRLKPCPVCGKLSVEQFRPFCSRRCSDVDLNRWLSGVYAVPAKENDEDAGDDEAPPQQRAPQQRE